MKQVLCSVLMVVFIVSCKKETTSNDANTAEAYNKGTTEMFVESSIFPIAEDINQVFKVHYTDANINIEMYSQNEILRALYNDSIRLAILPKDFTEKELAVFKNRVVPKITTIGKDAVMFVTHKESNDTLINYNDLLDIYKGVKKTDKIYVIHDANSSIVEKIKSDANVNELSKSVYYVKTVEEIAKYIISNKNAVGIVGVNWLVQPTNEIKEMLKSLRSVYVYNDSLKKYISPSQSTIADNTYPLIRNINIIDVQGKTGLGTGFASFAASDKGQRIILKSGLMPVKMPKREINIIE